MGHMRSEHTRALRGGNRPSLTRALRAITRTVLTVSTALLSMSCEEPPTPKTPTRVSHPRDVSIGHVLVWGTSGSSEEIGSYWVRPDERGGCAIVASREGPAVFASGRVWTWVERTLIHDSVDESCPGPGSHDELAFVDLHSGERRMHPSSAERREAADEDVEHIEVLASAGPYVFTVVSGEGCRCGTPHPCFGATGYVVHLPDAVDTPVLRESDSAILRAILLDGLAQLTAPDSCGHPTVTLDDLGLGTWFPSYDSSGALSLSVIVQGGEVPFACSGVYSANRTGFTEVTAPGLPAALRSLGTPQTLVKCFSSRVEGFRILGWSNVDVTAAGAPAVLTEFRRPAPEAAEAQSGAQQDGGGGKAPATQEAEPATKPAEQVARADDPCRGQPACADLGRCTTGANGHCVAASDADCRAAPLVCRTHGYCTAVNGACRAANDSDCASAEKCSSAGRCVAQDGRCWRAATRGCASVCASDGECSAVAGVCRAMSDQDCRSSRSCSDAGRCNAEAGACVAMSDKDCRAAWVCRSWGWCKLAGKTCAVSSEADCAGSVFCQLLGRCHYLTSEPVCVALRPIDCTRSAGCRISGQCTPRDGGCLAVSRADCTRSSGCRDSGACSAIDGDCTALTDADCRMSAWCRDMGGCTARGGNCVATSDAECKRSKYCRENGTCTFDGNDGCE